MSNKTARTGIISVFSLQEMQTVHHFLLLIKVLFSFVLSSERCYPVLLFRFRMIVPTLLFFEYAYTEPTWSNQSVSPDRITWFSKVPCQNSSHLVQQFNTGWIFLYKFSSFFHSNADTLFFCQFRNIWNIHRNIFLSQILLKTKQRIYICFQKVCQRWKKCHISTVSSSAATRTFSISSSGSTF